MTRSASGGGRWRAPAAVLLCATLLGGCAGAPTGASSHDPSDPNSTPVGSSAPVSSPRAASPTGGTPAVRPLDHRIPADVLISAKHPLAPALRHQLADAHGVRSALSFRLGTATLDGHRVTVAAVDPSTFRAYTPTGTAAADPLWASVARGELAIAHQVAHEYGIDLGGSTTLGRGGHRVGAFATTLPGVDVVVDTAIGRRLGLRRHTGMVVSVGKADPGAVGQRLNRLAGDRARVELLSAPNAVPRSFLSGSAAAKAFGTFSYRYFADGTIAPDPAWAKANIVTAKVPVLGRVRCHRLMLPQLRGALRDVVRAGLADAIHPGQYGGCYVPRFIESNPNRPISLHTWGIAIDLNVAENERGTRGQMNRHVVAIFKRWGFAWGGDWHYTDPMHFELAALLKPSQRPR